MTGRKGKVTSKPFGEHTKEILKEYGYSDGEIDKMCEDGVCMQR